jgi:hypothetical protein
MKSKSKCVTSRNHIWAQDCGNLDWHCLGSENKKNDKASSKNIEIEKIPLRLFTYQFIMVICLDSEEEIQSYIWYLKFYGKKILNIWSLIAYNNVKLLLTDNRLNKNIW